MSISIPGCNGDATTEIRNHIALTFMNNALVGGNVLSAAQAFDMANDYMKLAKDIVNESKKIPGITNSAEVQIMDLIACQKIIDAIKLYRACTGASLKDAKDVIDKLRGL